MKFKYCPDCGELLETKDLGDELNVPWCNKCSRPWFDIFPTATISLVYNDRNQVLLLRQAYISTRFHNLVSGYIQPGENAEICARREIEEETGIKTDDLELVLTSWFPKKEMLMIGFFAHAKNCDLKLSSEVDSAAWCDADKILQLLSDNPHSASRRLAMAFLQSMPSNKISEHTPKSL